MIKKKTEKGFTLVLALVLLLVMSLMGGSLIVISAQDHSSNNQSDIYQQTFYVAETGLMEGEKFIINKYLGDWNDSGTIRNTEEAGAPLNAVVPEQSLCFKSLISKYSFKKVTNVDFKSTIVECLSTTKPST